MEVIITKTSAQAQAEIKERSKKSTCPECGDISIGIVTTRTSGFLAYKVEKKHSYSCFRCGCCWNTGWIVQK